MDNIDKLREEYQIKFNDNIPNMTISFEEEIEILECCLKEGKDAYELGYFDLDNIY